MKRWIIATAVVATFAGGCKDDGTGQGGDTATGDVTGADTAAQDTASGDTAAQDTAGGDTAAQDTAGGDTATADSATQDTTAGDTAAQDGATEDTGADDAAAGCEGDTPLCAPSCGGDSFFGEATCEGGKWVCEEGIPTSECPPGSCFGEKYPGEICTDQGWACAPDAAAYAECHAVMCLTCAGWNDPAAPTSDCACSCQNDQVLCQKVGPQICEPTSESGLSEIAIKIGATDCTFTLAEAAAGITIPYTITIAEPVEGAIALPQDAGQCDQPGPSGLILFEQLFGNDQNYCLCDSGLCQGPDETPVTLAPGTWTDSFEWDGRNWFGQSDTGNPKGDPFPPGDYTLTVSAKGKVVEVDSMTPFEVKATVVIRLIP